MLHLPFTEVEFNKEVYTVEFNVINKTQLLKAVTVAGKASVTMNQKVAKRVYRMSIYYNFHATVLLVNNF